MPEFMWLAIASGVLIALVTGPLGAFVVWRRMAYFGDTLAHSALLGVALGFLFDLHSNITVIACCVGLALILVAIQRQKRIATDTLLGIMAHSSLSLGVVTVSLLDNVRVDLMAYLFGDLLSVTPEELLTIGLGGGLVLALLAYKWHDLLAITIHEELAEVEGVNTAQTRLLLMLLVATVIAVAMKMVGILLITALMIIPAATAQRIAKTPEQMAAGAAGFGVCAVLLGLTLSWHLDTPAGPSVVVMSMLLFVAASLLPQGRRA